MINADSKKATGQVTHTDSTPFLPMSIVLRYRARPHSPEITPLCHISAVPLTLQWHSSPSPARSPAPTTPLLTSYNEKSPPPQTHVFPHRCSCLSPGFPYNGNAPLSLIHHLATSPYLHLLRNETFPFVLPNLHVISIFLSSAFFSSKSPYPHGSSHCPVQFQKEDSLFLLALVKLFLSWLFYYL